MNRTTARVLLLATALAVSLIAAELAYRMALFSPEGGFQGLKDPALHADYFSEDLYWKLQALWSDEHRAPRRPHPRLGWVGSFARDTLRHHEARRLDGRRPVLLYGDSFADCMPEVACFEDLLLGNKEFSEGHLLLNYGVGGYGLDQTFLLFQGSLDHFDDPFVVFSLFTYDIDRCLLSFRIGQKPQFAVDGDTLVLEDNKIYPSAADYLDAHPPRAFSFLYRRVLFGGLLPEGLASALRNEAVIRRRKIEVSAKILASALAELEARELDFVFLVFHGHRPSDNSLFGGTDWREGFLRRWLGDNGVPHIWSKELVAKDRARGPAEPSSYLDPDNLHPTEHFNRLVAEEIRRRVLGGE